MTDLTPREIVSELDCFLIDPAPDNTAARRASAKVGHFEPTHGTHADGPCVRQPIEKR